MEKSKIIYQDNSIVYAKFNNPQSDDYIEYKSILQIRDSGIPPFRPMPPEKHIIELYVKLGRWLGKFGYTIR